MGTVSGGPILTASISVLEQVGVEHFVTGTLMVLTCLFIIPDFQNIFERRRFPALAPCGGAGQVRAKP